MSKRIPPIYTPGEAAKLRRGRASRGNGVVKVEYTEDGKPRFVVTPGMSKLRCGREPMSGQSDSLQLVFSGGSIIFRRKGGKK